VRKLNGFLFSRQRVTSFNIRFKDTARRIRCFPAVFEPRQTSAACCVKSKTFTAMSLQAPIPSSSSRKCPCKVADWS